MFWQILAWKFKQIIWEILLYLHLALGKSNDYVSHGNDCFRGLVPGVRVAAAHCIGAMPPRPGFPGPAPRPQCPAQLASACTVNLTAIVWSRLLRKRWVLTIVFPLSLVHFLTSTFKQEERAVRDGVSSRFETMISPFCGKCSLTWAIAVDPATRLSFKGSTLSWDKLGYVCERKDFLVIGCCKVNVQGTKQ